MEKLAQVAHHEKYCEETRRGKLMSASDETHWGIVGQCNGGITVDGGTHLTTAQGRRILDDKTRSSAQEGVIENKSGTADCACGKVETQWHILPNCKENGMQSEERK